MCVSFLSPPLTSIQTLNKYFYRILQSIVDLLIPGQTPGIKEQLVDLYGKPELLFFGPDGALRFF
jgi:hypothetical protein